MAPFFSTWRMIDAGHLHGAGLDDRLRWRWRERSAGAAQPPAASFFTMRTSMPPSGARFSCTSSMKLRMKKMPRPLDLRMFSGASGSATSSGSKPSPWSRDADDELGRRVGGGEGELDGDELVGMFAVAVLDGVDDRLADGDADPVDRILVEGGHLPHAIAEDLHEIHHVEEARDLQPDEAAARHHAVEGSGRSMQGTRVNNILRLMPTSRLDLDSRWHQILPADARMPSRTRCYRRSMPSAALPPS